jgi:hypothetical protein
MDQWTPHTEEKEVHKQFYTNYMQIKSNPLVFLSCLDVYAAHFKTNHIMITAGMDFAWQFAHVNYDFFDNATAILMNDTYGHKFNFFYSTVDNYMQAV